MSHLKLTVKKPGNLLGVFLRCDITQEQYAMIVMLLSAPDTYTIAEKPKMGFRPLDKEAQRAEA